MAAAPSTFPTVTPHGKDDATTVRSLLAAILGAFSFEAALLANFYPVVFITLLISGLGMPVPEDVTLITAGAVLRHHPEAANYYGMVVAAIIGVLSGDVLMYLIGRRFGPNIVQHRFFSRIVTPKRFRKASAHFQRHGAWLCFISRFLLGVRSATWLTAGATRYPFWKFISADGAAACISTPFWLMLGWRFAFQLGKLYDILAEFRGILLAAIGVVVGLLILRWYRRRRENTREILKRRESRKTARMPKSIAAEGQ